MSKNIILSLLLAVFVSYQSNAQNQKQIDSLLTVISVSGSYSYPSP